MKTEQKAVTGKTWRGKQVYVGTWRGEKRQYVWVRAIGNVNLTKKFI